jgi:hypothetical protein
MHTNFQSGNLKGRDQFEFTIACRKILNLILEKCDAEMWTGLNWIRINAMASPCKHNNERLVSKNGREFLGYLSNYEFLNNKSILK